MAKLMKCRVRFLDHFLTILSFSRKLSHENIHGGDRGFCFWFFFSAEKLVSVKERNTDIFFFPEMLEIYMR